MVRRNKKSGQELVLRLEVPLCDKSLVEELGGKYIADLGRWYAIEPKDVTVFEKWASKEDIASYLRAAELKGI